MAPRQEEEIQTVPYLISLIPRGGALILLFENEALSYQLLPKIIRSVPDERTVRLFTGRIDESLSQARRKVEQVNLSTVSNLRETRQILLRQLRTAKRNELLVFDLPARQRQSATAFAGFLEDSTILLRKRKQTSIWLLSGGTTAFASLQKRALQDIIARIWNGESAGSPWFQVLRFPDAPSPNTFVPRLIKESGGKLLFGPTAPPTTVYDGSTTSGVVSRDLFEDVFQKSVNGMLIFDLAGSFRRINPAGSRIVGFDNASLQTVTLQEMVVPEEWFATRRAMLTLKEKRRLTTQLRIHRSNRRAMILEIDAFPLTGGLYGAFFREATGRGKADDQGVQTLVRQASLFEDGQIPQALFDERRLLSYNKAFELFCQSLGRKAQGSTLTQVLGKENKALVREIFATRDANLTLDREVELRAGDTGSRNVRLMLRAQPHQGRFAIHCSFVETTAQAAVIRELRRETTELGSLLKEAAGSVLVLSGTRIVFATAEASLILGYPDPDTMKGLDCEAIVGGKGRQSVVEKLIGGKWTSTKRTVEFTGARKDGSALDLIAVATRTVLASEPVVALVLSNVSAIRKQEETFRGEMLSKAFLLDVDRGFSVSEDLHVALESGLGVLLKALRFDVGAVYLKEAGGLSATIEKGIDQNLQGAITAGSAEEGFAGFVFKTAESLVLDLGNYPAHLPLRSHFEAAQVRHAICIPLRSGDQVNGMILLCSQKAKGPAPEVLGALNEASLRIGQHVANILQFNRVQVSERHYRGLLEALPDVVYRTNHHGAITYISPNVELLVNHRPEDFSRSPELWRQIVHPDDKSVYGRRVSTGQEDVERVVLEYRVLPRGKAEYRWVRDSVSYSRDDRGTVSSMTGLVRDITAERVRTESLTASVEMKTNVLESIREGVAVYDGDLRCRDWNDAMEEITGLSRSTVIGLPIGKTTINVVSLELVAMLQSALNGQTVSSDDIILNTGSSVAEESYYWVRCFPLKDGARSIRGVVLTFTDVTARRALEQSVRESEETLRNVIDGMGDALMISDLQGRVWEVNKEFTRITGYSRRDVLGMSFPYPWLVDEEMARFVSWIAELRERSFLRDFDMTWHSQDGRKVAISINTSLLRNASGEPVAMLNIARDISDRKKLMTELERRNRELETLNAISASITTSLHVEEVLERAGEQIKELMSANIVLIYLKDPRQNRLTLGCHSGLPEEAVERIRELHPSESATGAVVAGGAPLLIRTGLAVDPRITEEGREIFGSLELDSLGVIPLRSKDHVLGALDVGFKGEHDFTDEEQQFLALIGAQLGSAIENAQLYNEVHRQVRRLTSLYEVGRGLAGSLDLKTILSTVYGEVSKAIPVDHFIYYVYSGAKESVFPLVEFGGETPDINSGGRKEIFLRKGDPFRESLAQNTALFFSTGNGGGAMIIAPVRSGHTVAGFLVVRGSAVDLDDDAHLRLLESIATLTELALDKASLYVDIVNKSKQIETRNKELDDFTYVVSHDLKEPLISIEGYSKILLKEFEREVGDEGREYLASIVNSSTRLKNLIDDLLTLSRLGRVKEVSQNVSLSQTVKEVLQDLQFTIRERNLIVEVGENLPVVRYNPTQLSIVIRNLISNAIKFNKTAQPRISIQCVRGEEEFTVSISDNGIGIEKEYFEKIFMIFQRLHRTEEFRGTGAGLTIVKKIVENHGGMIRVESAPGEGSTFSFTIPISSEQ